MKTIAEKTKDMITIGTRVRIKDRVEHVCAGQEGIVEDIEDVSDFPEPDEYFSDGKAYIVLDVAWREQDLEVVA